MDYKQKVGSILKEKGGPKMTNFLLAMGVKKKRLGIHLPLTGAVTGKGARRADWVGREPRNLPSAHPHLPLCTSTHTSLTHKLTSLSFSFSQSHPPPPRPHFLFLFFISHFNFLGLFRSLFNPFFSLFFPSPSSLLMLTLRLCLPPQPAPCSPNTCTQTHFIFYTLFLWHLFK